MTRFVASLIAGLCVACSGSQAFEPPARRSVEDLRRIPGAERMHDYIGDLVSGLGRNEKSPPTAGQILRMLQSKRVFSHQQVLPNMAFLLQSPEWLKQADDVHEAALGRPATIWELFRFAEVYRAGPDSKYWIHLLKSWASRPALTIRGVVVDRATRKPLPHAFLTTAEGEFETDANGRFSLATHPHWFVPLPHDDEPTWHQPAALQDLRCRVCIVSRDGYMPQEVVYPSKGPERQVDGMEIELAQGRTATLKVYDPVGKPAGETEVSFDLRFDKGSCSFRTWTDSEGVAALPPIPSGAKPQFVYLHRLGAGSASFDAIAINDRGEALATMARVATPVSGRVVDEKGVGVPGATVDLTYVGGSGRTTNRVFTAPDGSFATAAEADAARQLLVESPHHAYQFRPVRIQNGTFGNVTVAPARGGWISGAVVREDGGPAANAYVGWPEHNVADDDWMREPMRRGNVARLTVADEEGRFRMGPLPEATTFRFFAVLDEPHERGQAVAKVGDEGVKVVLKRMPAPKAPK